ncbi:MULTISPECIES: hypothetical protein [Xanthomonas]|uniref:hypothetical protein n=1 Tax=Xanthomonas TaxID=338 RepID=UPI000E1F7A58|nr:MULTISPECIES: hypothetical protein [Xanthomonas]MEA9588424.1 hypothetical protein [Xanthomonas sp. WHRI 10064B]MEA9613409.1 hypothetical protein [Xanthomonas sp. WHRI 10064A]
MTLEEEAERATQLLVGKVVETVWRHRPGEIGIQFKDGCCLFADINGNGLELSITGCADD